MVEISPPPPPPPTHHTLKYIEICFALFLKPIFNPLLSHHTNPRNYLLTGNKVQLYFTEMNSRYFKHCNGIFVINHLLTGNNVQLYFTEMNSRYFIFRAKHEK